MTSYTMPSCGDWSSCNIDRETLRPGKECVECEQLNDYCSGYSGAGYGKFVPASCSQTCCVNGLIKVSPEVKASLKNIANNFMKNKNVKHFKCFFENDKKFSETVMMRLLQLYQKNAIDFENPDDAVDKLVSLFMYELVDTKKAGDPCFVSDDNNVCKKGVFGINAMGKMVCVIDSKKEIEKKIERTTNKLLDENTPEEECVSRNVGGTNTLRKIFMSEVTKLHEKGVDIEDIELVKSKLDKPISDIFDKIFKDMKKVGNNCFMFIDEGCKGGVFTGSDENLECDLNIPQSQQIILKTEKPLFDNLNTFILGILITIVVIAVSIYIVKNNSSKK